MGSNSGFAEFVAHGTYDSPTARSPTLTTTSTTTTATIEMAAPNAASVDSGEQARCGDTHHVALRALCRILRIVQRNLAPSSLGFQANVGGVRLVTWWAWGMCVAVLAYSTYSKSLLSLLSMCLCVWVWGAVAQWLAHSPYEPGHHRLCSSSRFNFDEYLERVLGTPLGRLRVKNVYLERCLKNKNISTGKTKAAGHAWCWPPPPPPCALEALQGSSLTALAPTG